jgi:hypothetical protein
MPNDYEDRITVLATSFLDKIENSDIDSLEEPAYHAAWRLSEALRDTEYLRKNPQQRRAEIERLLKKYK